MNEKVIKIAGVGCALADYLYTKVKFESNEFSQYLSKQVGDGGLSPGKLVFTEELEQFSSKPYAQILSDIIGHNSFDNFNIGGPALVSLIHAAQLLPKNGFETSYYGCIGDDKTGELIFELVTKTPLNTENYIKILGKQTAFTDVLSDSSFDYGNGERTFVNNIGASWDYSSDMLPDSFFDAQIVCFGGTALVPQIHDNLTYLLQKAKANNAITVVNTVYDFRNEKKNPGYSWPLGKTNESFTLIDLLIMDCEEALKISDTNTIDDAACYFEKQLSAFIITNGSKNLIAYSNGDLFKPVEKSAFPVSKKIVAELKSENALTGDTTGCGDNFVGGIIASLALQLSQKPIGNFDLIESLSWAVASGGFACFYAGGTYFEKNAGEKLGKIQSYQIDYLTQLNIANE